MICALRQNGLRASSSARRSAPGRSSTVQVLARGPIVTKKGVAFKKQPEPEEDPEEDIGAADKAVIALGLPGSLLCYWSEYTLATAGAGLPEGPGGALGAAEGISYLAVVGTVAYSLYTKVSTGSGLPPGPAGLLGATEGLSYLALLGGIVAFGISTTL